MKKRTGRERRDDKVKRTKHRPSIYSTSRPPTPPPWHPSTTQPCRVASRKSLLSYTGAHTSAALGN
ncbi:predicted protein [Plenodomus lingam JN3]|uniref:Predicted protein n=1 Tax=Leptosphaeria maculans (strain JN3 / isolate v23.1.3 / race Av1-4-5-6-7-8) TaxID=985895 RepID=E4ZLZ7_LEPMJ|nr:predicted protein [Plenodomus lingam JN3]CBX92827.1 predicted protein [Plenodomus lingam JN3]